MDPHYDDMYSEHNMQNRSPSRVFGGSTINRQPSRQFEQGFAPAPLQGLYTPEDYPRHDTGRNFDRMMPPTTTMNQYPYEGQPWSYNGANGGAHTMGGTSRGRGSARRPALPVAWGGESQMAPPPQHYTTNNMYNHSFPASQVTRVSPIALASDESEDLIPTAIVIKNIPFALQKEKLLEYMQDHDIPRPYAFNYHFDNHVFRGLAFANFSSPEDTREVILRMNNLELHGRKLRVEYKKMLPVEEREKIEREKRKNRGQLEEQHRPQQAPLKSIRDQTSMNSLNGSALAPMPAPPSPVNTRAYDLNDPATLAFYNELMLFKNDQSREEQLIFPASLSPDERRTVHILAHHMGLEHNSHGNGAGRYVSISRRGAASPPIPHYPNYYNESRRGLNRAATVDFSEVRDNHHSHTLGRQSSGLLEIPGSPGINLAPGQNLRPAKSLAELRSYSSSPVPSSASFPANLAQNVSRLTEYSHSSAASGTPNLTPTSVERMNGRDDLVLMNNMNNLSLSGFDNRPSNSRLNNGGSIGQEREHFPVSAGAIGSQRPVNGNTYEEGPWNTGLPQRQPRGPGGEGTSGFSRPRQNGHVNRGSDSSDRSGLTRH